MIAVKGVFRQIPVLCTRTKALQPLQRLPTLWYTPQLSFSSGKEDPPDDFFDAETEKDKEFLDVAKSMQSGGLENLTTQKGSWSWEEATELPSNALFDGIEDDDTGSEARDTSSSYSPPDVFIADDVGQHLSNFQDSTPYIPTEMLNYNEPWRTSDTIPEPELESFIADTSPDKFHFRRQGDRACPGKLQRHGKNPMLRCHLIDLDALTHLDVITLRKFLSDDAEILGRRTTGLCAKCQRKVSKTIKRARNFGILPRLDEFLMNDASPNKKEHEDFHNAIVDSTFVSKTIL